MPSLEEQAGPNTTAGNDGGQAATTKMGIDAQNTSANSPLQPATPAMHPDKADAPPSSKELFDTEQGVGQGAVEPGGEQENKEANPDDVTAAPAPATDSHQPNTYGGNFGNDVQNSFEDHDRASNQRSDAARGEFGQQQYNQGSTHGGYGNQYRETNFAATHNEAAEATEEKYYGQGSAQPGPQHNSYRDYDGRDLAPAQQGHAVRDTPHPTAASSNSAGNVSAQDTRNLPNRGGEAAAFQTDNGSPTTGGGYAADYGHTSGVGLPAGTPDNYKPSTPGSQNQEPGQPSPRGGYDSQSAPANPDQNAPAPVSNPGNPQTGDSRNGFGPGGSKEGNASQGHGSQGGSYDDENPGARGADYDKFTQQDKAQNYGQAKRDNFRPADDTQEADHGAPRRNAGRDED